MEHTMKSDIIYARSRSHDWRTVLEEKHQDEREPISGWGYRQTLALLAILLLAPVLAAVLLIVLLRLLVV
jgi:hypothetical protein